MAEKFAKPEKTEKAEKAQKVEGSRKSMKLKNQNRPSAEGN